MDIPTKIEIYLMDELLIFEYQTNAQNNGRAFIEKHFLTNNEYIKIYNLVKYFGCKAKIISTANNGFLVDKPKAEQFILDDGFENYFDTMLVRY